MVLVMTRDADDDDDQNIFILIIFSTKNMFYVSISAPI